MDRRGGNWVTVTGWRAVVVTILLLPFILIFIVIRPFLPKDWGKEDRTPAEVAGYIRDFLDGSGGEWDWDDFTSVPIKDAALEEIRNEAEMVNPFLDDQGREVLEGLYRRARKLASPYQS